MEEREHIAGNGAQSFLSRLLYLNIVNQNQNCA